MNIIKTVCWVVFFACIGCLSCKGKEQQPKVSTEESLPVAAVEEKTQPEASPKLEEPKFRGPGERLVKNIEGFKITGNPRYFGPDNLYDLINGGAEIYTELGLVEMVTADYTSENKPNTTITAEIYDMGAAKNASARFARFLEGRNDPSSAGKGLPADMVSRGILGGASATFWKDKYLINLTLLDESENSSLESMTSLGAELLPKFAKVLDNAI